MTQRVDHTLAVHSGAAGALELGVEEAQIEHRVVRDKRGVAEKGDELVHPVGEQRLVLEEVDRQPVNLERPLRHVALRIEVAVEHLAGRESG